ncbi:MAG: AraC family transcriptional regulator [Lysinibacillus sp.]
MNLNEVYHFYTLAPISLVDVVTNKFLKRNELKTYHTTSKVCALIFPLSGKAKFTINDTTHFLEQGQILHSGPNLPLTVEVISEEPFEYAVIHIRLSLAESEQFPLFFKHTLFHVGEALKLTGMVQQLVLNFSAPGGLSFLQSKILFLQIIEEMLISSKKMLYQMKIDNMSSIVDYIQTHFTEPISIIDVAHYFQLDRRNLTYLFEKDMGVSPNHYLTALRMQKAKFLLRTSPLPIAQIAEKVGYLDNFYFSRIFKKQHGFSPSDFRKHMKEEQDGGLHIYNTNLKADTSMP